MKVLIVGAGSPLGRRVVLGLRDRHDVTVIARPGELDAPTRSGLGARVHEADLSAPERYGHLVTGVDVAIQLVDRCQASDGEVLDHNLKGTQSLLHALSGWGPPKRLIFLSTALLDHPSPDEPDVAPSRYGSAWLAGRCAAEARVNLWARKLGVDTLVIRAGHIYGAVGVDGPLTGWMEAAAASAETSGVLAMRGADTPLPFVHVDELARSIVAAVDGRPMPAQAQLIPGLERVEAVGLRMSLGQVHAAMCQRTQRTQRLVTPRTSLGSRVLGRLGKGPVEDVPRFLKMPPVKTVNADWIAAYGQRDTDELVEALVGGAC